MHQNRALEPKIIGMIFYMPKMHTNMHALTLKVMHGLQATNIYANILVDPQVSQWVDPLTLKYNIRHHALAPKHIPTYMH